MNKNIGINAPANQKFGVGDKVETYVYMATTNEYADTALVGGIVTKVGKKKVQVLWERAKSPKWVYPHQITFRTNWLLPNETEYSKTDVHLRR